MKKILAIFLLAIFLFNYMGYFIASRIAVKEAKREMRTAIKAGLIDKTMTVLITIPKKELASVQFLDKGKEIIYKGEMYDIISSTESAENIDYLCVNDRNEKELLANLEQHIGTHVYTATPVKNNSGKKISQNIVKLYFSTESVSFCLNQPLVSTIQSPFLANFNSEYVENYTPPPELV